MSTEKVFSDTPIGKVLYIWHNREEVAKFLELCCFSPDDLPYFHAKFVPDESRDLVYEYIDDDMIDGSADFFKERVVKIAVHDTNSFFDHGAEPAFTGDEGVRASEVSLDADFWHDELFPYIGYVWFEKVDCRGGNNVFAIAVIQSLHKMNSVQMLEERLNSDTAKRQVELRNMIMNRRIE